MKRLVIPFIIFFSSVNNSYAKDLVLGCKWTNQVTIKKNHQEILKRSDVANPNISDGYIHYNFDKEYLISDLSKLSRYGTIYNGENNSKKITLAVSNGSEVISFFVTYGIIENFLDSKLEQNSFSINKYNNRMTIRAYTVGKPNGDRVIINYNCNKIPKPNY